MTVLNGQLNARSKSVLKREFPSIHPRSRIVILPYIGRAGGDLSAVNQLTDEVASILGDLDGDVDATRIAELSRVEAVKSVELIFPILVMGGQILIGAAGSLLANAIERRFGGDKERSVRVSFLHVDEEGDNITYTTYSGTIDGLRELKALEVPEGG